VQLLVAAQRFVNPVSLSNRHDTACTSGILSSVVVLEFMFAAQRSRFSRHASVGWSLLRKFNLKARGAADLQRDSIIGFMCWLGRISGIRLL